MPAAGQRKVIIDGEEKFVAGEDAELEDLLTRGCVLQAQLEAAQGKLELIRARLAEMATSRRGTKSTVHLTAISGRRCTVSWGGKVEVDPTVVEAMKDELGDRWGEVFRAKVEYSLAKGFKQFMKVPQGALEKCKKRIATAINRREYSPRVQLFDLGDEAE